ncbi:hypothetical protein S958_003816 [Salmonella enterica subsp. enterica]|nr:hypothetical protein [Salmonella enterica subsp. enterica serovar Chichester]EDT2839331.1 hypothetical protein [Salmonella enterica subsp. enterica]
MDCGRLVQQTALPAQSGRRFDTPLTTAFNTINTCRYCHFPPINHNVKNLARHLQNL